MDPKAAKAELREAIAQRMARLSDNDRAAESRSICRRILQILPKEPATIAAYYSLKDEVDLRPLLPELEKLGHRVYLPCVDKGKLAFRLMTSPETMQKGAFGVAEPPSDSPLMESADIALIPGRAFDEQGNRMGRGNGGYDIWIHEQRKSNPETRMIGIAFEAQLTHAVPMEEHDEKVDAVLTARGLTERKG